MSRFATPPDQFSGLTMQWGAIELRTKANSKLRSCEAQAHKQFHWPLRIVRLDTASSCDCFLFEPSHQESGCR